MAANPCKGIESAVSNIVGRLHVGESDGKVADYAASKLKKSASAAFVRQVKRCAIKLHHANQKLYGLVMGGRRG